MNLTTTFLGWYDAQNDEVRSTLAFSFRPFIPDLPKSALDRPIDEFTPEERGLTLKQLAERVGDDWHSDPQKAFRRWLSAKRSRTETVGALLLVRATFTVLASRQSNPAHWIRAKRLNEARAAEQEQLEPGNDDSRKTRERVADFGRREEMWEKVAADWRKLCETSLSDELFETWIEEGMLR